MGTIKNFKREKLIIGLLISTPERREEVETVLAGEFGPVDYVSREIDFTFSDYYNREMGEKITRIFYSFENLIAPDTLGDIKIRTNELETKFAVKGKRKANFDPGILNLSRLLLASTKDNMHRVPLTKGIYAEITLIYMHKSFHSLLWTYPDYASEEYKKIFLEIRENFRLQLKQER